MLEGRRRFGYAHGVQQMRVIPLGTSAGTPTRDRNVASLALLCDSRALLFDCGEGTQHRLIDAPFSVSRIEAIFVTHMHGDHLYGLPGLLATFSMLDRQTPLAIFGPPEIEDFISVSMRSSNLWLGYDLRVVPVTPGVILDDPGLSVSAAVLDHRVTSFGFAVQEKPRPGTFDVAKARALGVPEGPMFGRLQHGEPVELEDGRIVEPAAVVGAERPGRRLVICGDTRPADATVDLARGSDLLVHESTYGDDLASEAERRGHSTAREAAIVARAAGARRLLLTHFSPRYTDPDELVSQAREVFPEASAARDLEPLEIPFREE